MSVSEGANAGEGREKAAPFEALVAFRILMIDAELSVHRAMLADILRQRGMAGNLIECQSKIDEMVVRFANDHLAEYADLYPGQASFFAELLEDWKRKRGV